MKPYVYVTCPCCDQKIETPFQRFSGPVTYIHHARGGKNHGTGKSCRLVVIPDPNGHDHKVMEVHRKMRLEIALEWAIKRYGQPGPMRPAA